MKALIASTTLAISLMTATGAYAKIAEIPAPATAPAGSTGICNDGSFTTTATKSGACQGHKGVQNWYTTAGATASTAPASVPASTPAATTKKPFSFFGKKPAASAPATTASPAAATTTAAAAAPGGGAGQVWVNTKSNVYHCFGSKYYGKTKTGQYMTEAAAKAAGAHGDHGKACS